MPDSSSFLPDTSPFVLPVLLAALSALAVHHGMRWVRWRSVRPAQWAGALFALWLAFLLTVTVPGAGVYFDGVMILRGVFVPSVYVGSVDVTRWALYASAPFREAAPVLLPFVVPLAVLLRRSEGHGLPRALGLAGAQLLLLSVVFVLTGLLAAPGAAWAAKVFVSAQCAVAVLAFLPPVKRLLPRRASTVGSRT